MGWRYGMVAGLALTAALAGRAAAQAPNLIDCAGPFARNADEAALVKAFGTANVKQSEIDVGEGMTEPGTLLFAGQPKREIAILWHDNAKRSRPSSVTIRDESGWSITVPGQPETRIAIGTPLTAVEAANGKPFMVNGFGWDGGGYAAQWQGGKLGRHPAGCAIGLRFGPEANANAKALDRVNGDRQFSSANANMRAVKPRVESISLAWPES